MTVVTKSDYADSKSRGYYYLVEKDRYYGKEAEVFYKIIEVAFKNILKAMLKDFGFCVLVHPQKFYIRTLKNDDLKVYGVAYIEDFSQKGGKND